MSQNIFEPIIGVEVHVELATQTKMFCSCKAEHFGAKPNTLTCPVCLALPGALPYPNQKALEQVLLVGLALNCPIPLFSKFDRKNYFYPDLPKGYQISQYDLPLVGTGDWKFETGKSIRIRRVHLEEDTAKLTHQGDNSFIDFNRAGVPLMEIVTEPDFTTSWEVKIFLQKLQQLVRYLGVANADMEKGEMRCEPNVNLKITEEEKTYFTPIVEIKNVNSFRFVAQAINFEINRQIEEFKKTRVEKGAGNKETRGWDENKKVTFIQREKEEAEDYRYFPEPDIPPLFWEEEQIMALKLRLPEFPEEKKKRFMKNFGLSEAWAEIFTNDKEKADFYEEAVKAAEKKGIIAKEIANLIINKRLKVSDGVSVGEFVNVAIEQKQEAILSEEELKKIIEEVLKKETAAVVDFKKGKTQALEYLLGQVARTVKGKVDPNTTRELLLEKLR